MKMSKNTIESFWSFCIVLCLLLSIIALFFASCAKSGSKSEDAKKPGTGIVIEEADLSEIEPNPDDPANAGGNQSSRPSEGDSVPSDEVVPENTPSVSSAELTETADAGQAYVDKFIFLGDSTTYGLKYYEVLSGGKNTTQVWTPASGTLTLSRYNIDRIVYPDTGEELSIFDAVERKQPEYMLITLGVNGVSFMDEEWFKSDYTSLIEGIREKSPSTKIILNTIYPVAPSYQYIKDISNEKIYVANTWIKSIAENTGVKLLNSYSVMVGPDGTLPETSHNGDGIHLTGESFKRVLEYLRTHEYK